MLKRISRAILLAVLVVSLALVGCTNEKPETTDKPAEEQTAKPSAIKIGTLPTEDSLPLWVAEQKGYFEEAGLPEVEIVVFQAAQERDAALASGAIDGFMGDMIAAANLEAGGTPVSILTVMLGADQSQGRFGVVARPQKDAKGVMPSQGNTTMENIAGLPVGTSSATIQEYVLDGLAREADVPADQVKVEEVKKVPVRFELLMQGKLEFAALPEPFLSLAQQGGATLIGDDTKAKANLSQTVLLVTDEYLRAEGGVEAAEAVLAAWDKAVDDINAEPDSYRPLLVDKARLPESLADSYKVNTYPKRALPTQGEVEAIVKWMRDKGYLDKDVSYSDLTLVTP